MSWPVPDETWNFRSSQEDPVNFTWVDLSQGSQETATNMWHPSIGAVAKVPGSAADGTPNFYTIPCIVDARWAASSALYQPTISEMVMSNLSSPAAIALSSISGKAKANPRQQLGIGGAIQIGPEWANTLNAGRYSISLWTDVVVLFIHIVMVLSYAGYQVFLRFRGRWWATTAWDDAAELLMLAWDSTPTGAFRGVEEAKSSLWAQNISVRERGGGEGDAIELVARRSDTASGEGLLMIGKKYV
ncbi:hypothetical protein ACQKWADRAFT_329612 [Trichoderma austrokoningii]